MEYNACTDNTVPNWIRKFPGGLQSSENLPMFECLILRPYSISAIIQNYLIAQ